MVVVLGVGVGGGVGVGVGVVFTLQIVPVATQLLFDCCVGYYVVLHLSPCSGKSLPWLSLDRPPLDDSEAEVCNPRPRSLSASVDDRTHKQPVPLASAV